MPTYTIKLPVRSPYKTTIELEVRAADVEAALQAAAKQLPVLKYTRNGATWYDEADFDRAEVRLSNSEITG